MKKLLWKLSCGMRYGGENVYRSGNWNWKTRLLRPSHPYLNGWVWMNGWWGWPLRVISSLQPAQCTLRWSRQRGDDQRGYARRRDLSILLIGRSRAATCQGDDGAVTANCASISSHPETGADDSGFSWIGESPVYTPGRDVVV